MKKNAKIGLESFVIGILIFSLIIVFGVSFIGNVNESYNLSMSTDDFNETYNRIDEMYNLSQDMKDDTLNADISTDAGSWESMAKGSYSAVRLVKNTFGIVGDIINAIAKVLHIPSYIIRVALAILTVFVVFSIIYLVMGVVRN